MRGWGFRTGKVTSVLARAKRLVIRAYLTPSMVTKEKLWNGEMEIRGSEESGKNVRSESSETRRTMIGKESAIA